MPPRDISIEVTRYFVAMFALAIVPLLWASPSDLRRRLTLPCIVWGMFHIGGIAVYKLGVAPGGHIGGALAAMLAWVSMEIPDVALAGVGFGMAAVKVANRFGMQGLTRSFFVIVCACSAAIAAWILMQTLFLPPEARWFSLAQSCIDVAARSL